MASLKGRAFFTRGFDSDSIKEDLCSQTEDRQVSALYQVVAYMTVGKDMSGLFNEVSALTSSTNVLMKRMAYLYLVQNARIQPEKAVLQAGTFVKDTLHDSPLIRGAALRTLTLLQLPVMADFAAGPLRRCLEDTDPYVKRAATMGVLKYFCASSTAMFEVSLLEKLTDCLHDENHAVVASCVSSLLELISRQASPALRRLLTEAENHLVDMLAESNEWSAQQLLEGIAFCLGQKRNPDLMSAEEWLRDAERALNAVIPFAFNDNLALALSALKVITIYLVALHEDPEYAAAQASVESKLAPFLAQALVSKIDSPRYEQRYIFLRNIQLFVKTALFKPYFVPHLPSFLIKFDDLIYIKLQKVNILVEMANEQNARRVLDELTIYSKDGDDSLSKLSVRSIGTLAARIRSISVDCVQELQKLIKTRVPRIVENSAIVVHTIMRLYPKQFNSIVPTLCESLTVLEDVDAKANVVWIIGEYGETIPKALDTYLPFFMDNFLEQPRLVQVGVLTTLTKLYLRNSSSSAAALAQLERMINLSVKSSFPDLRDRAYFYARLLTLDLKTATYILTQADKDPFELKTTDHLLTKVSEIELLSELGSLVSVEQKPLSDILGDNAVGSMSRFLRENLSDDDEDEVSTDGGNFPKDDAEARANGVGRSEGDKSYGTPTLTTPTTNHHNNSSHSNDNNSTSDLTNSEHKYKTVYETVIAAHTGSGVEVSMYWSQVGTCVVLSCRFQLYEGEDYVRQAKVKDLQVRWNMFSLGVAQAFPIVTLEPDDKPSDLNLLMSFNNQREPSAELQLAIDIEPVGVLYCVAPPIPPPILLLSTGGIEVSQFTALMKEYPTDAWRMPAQIAKIVCSTSRLTVNALRMHYLEIVYRKEFAVDGSKITAFFLYAQTIAKQHLLMEVTFEGDELIWIGVRSSYAPVASFFGEYVLRTIKYIGSSAKSTR